MGFVLDAILVKDLVGSREDDGTINYETINATGSTQDSLDVSKAEKGYSLDILYDNGVGLNVKFYLEVSTDNINFIPDTDSEVVVTDTSGNIILDVIDTNVNYVRLGYEITSGTVDIQSTIFAKRRH